MLRKIGEGFDTQSPQAHCNRASFSAVKDEALRLLHNPLLKTKLGKLACNLATSVSRADAVRLNDNHTSLHLAQDQKTHSPSRPLVLMTDGRQDLPVTVPDIHVRSVGMIGGTDKLVANKTVKMTKRARIAAKSFVAKTLLFSRGNEPTRILPLFAHVATTDQPTENALRFIETTNEWTMHASGETAALAIAPENVIQTSVKKRWYSILGALIKTDTKVAEHIYPSYQMYTDDLNTNPSDLLLTSQEQFEQSESDVQLVARMLRDTKDKSPENIAKIATYMFTEDESGAVDTFAIGRTLEAYYTLPTCNSPDAYLRGAANTMRTEADAFSSANLI